MRDGPVHVPPLGRVVAAPVSGDGTCARRRPSSDYKWPFAGEDIKQGIVGRFQNAKGIYVVNIVLLGAEGVAMRGVGRDGVLGQIKKNVVDGIGRY